MREPLIMWVVYDHPKDHPEYYIARKWIIEATGEKPTTSLVGFFNLQDLHDWFSEGYGMTFLYRNKEDDPVIIGTYL